MMYKGRCVRKTNETDIEIMINLDSTGKSSLNTEAGFFDHILDQLIRHSMTYLKIRAAGDIKIDDHHAFEGVGICIGKALKNSLGDKICIRKRLLFWFTNCLSSQE